MFFERRRRFLPRDPVNVLINALLATTVVLLLLPGRSLVAFDGTRQVAMLIPRGPEYRLGALDKVRVKVFAWRAARDEVFEWGALNGEYTIGASGTVSMPLIGEVAASGVTTAELAIEIAERLKGRIGLVERPDAAVEVVQFRPFYVTGDVDKPGEFPYRPGLIVLQALSLAGGQIRQADLGAMRLEREVIAKSGEIDQLVSERTAALARKARLEAELKGLPQIAFPADLARADAPAFAQTAMAQERAIFKTRRDAFDTQQKALEELRRYLKSEIASIERQIASHNEEVSIAREEYDGIKALVAKKLVVETRRLGLKRGLAQVEGNSLRLDSNLMRVKQDLSRADIALIELANTRGKEIATDLATTESLLDQVDRKIETAERLLDETETLAPRLVAARRGGGRIQPVYTIIRQMNGIVTEIAASETMHVLPGDTIKIELRTPSDALTADRKPLPDASGDNPKPVTQGSADGLMRKSEAMPRRQY